MIERIEENNQVTIREICTHVYERHNVKISESTVSRFFSSPRIVSMDLYMFTFKRVANREPTSNSPHIKDLCREEYSSNIIIFAVGTFPHIWRSHSFSWDLFGTMDGHHQERMRLPTGEIDTLDLQLSPSSRSTELSKPSSSRDLSLGRSSSQQWRHLYPNKLK